MASVDASRGLVLARKNGSGSNSTGIDTIDLNVSPKVASALLPSTMFTGDPIVIDSLGTIIPSPANVTVKTAGVFQGISYVDASGNQEFSRYWTGGTTATDIKIHVSTDPAQTYFIQADGAVTAAAGFGAGTYNGVWTAGAGSTRTGNSGYELDASGPVLTDVNLRVIRRAPWDTATSSSAGETDDYPWYEVRINNHIDNYTTATVSTA